LQKTALIFLLGFISFASAHETVTLCNQNETVVFSCNIQKKLLSVCIADNNETKAPSLLYRFGSEFTYPKNSSGQFFLSHLNSLRSREDRLRFTSGEYNYLVYSFTSSYEGNKSGVLVTSKSGKSIANKKCTDLMDLEPWPINLPSSLARPEEFDFSYELP